MKNSLLIFLALVVLITAGCSSNNSIPKAGESNSLSQTMPTMMVFPSDALMLKLGFLKEIANQGTTSYQRDYQQAFIKDSRLKFSIAAIEEQFSKAGFKLENMEQQLKQISNNNAIDQADNINRDIKTELLNTVRPDYIIELEHSFEENSNSRNGDGAMTFTLKCLDVYTNKTVASVTKSGISVAASGDMSSALKEVIEEKMEELKTQILAHFGDLKNNGVEITLRVATNSGVSLDDDCGEEEIREKIDAWLKQNTVNQSFKMTKNTKVEVYYTNVRIKAKEDNGMKYTASDFAKDLKKGLKKGCGLDVTNNTQSIGDAMVLIEGTK